MRTVSWLLFALLLLPAAAAQTRLLVGDSEVPGLDQQLVAGVSYAPAHALAAAFGAELELYEHSVALRLGGRLLQLRLVTDPTVAATGDPASLNGQPFEGLAAVRTGSTLLLPVKTVANAFGGHVTVFTGTRDLIEVRLPQARITGLERKVSAGREQVILTLSAPVPFSSHHNSALKTLQFSLDRTDPARLPPVTGSLFSEAWLQHGSAQPELRIMLADGVDWQVSSSAHGSGWQLQVSLAARDDLSGPEQAAPVPAGSRTVLLDPAADRSLIDLALGVAGVLRTQGIEVLLTREDASAAAGNLLAADAADLYLQLDQSADQFAIHWLADANDSAALQRASTLSQADRPALDRLRRQLLLGSYGGNARGAEQASMIAAALEITVASGLPLQQLAQSSGHGILLLVPPELLTDPALADRVATALHSVLVKP